MLLMSSLKCVFYLLQTGNSVLFFLENCIDPLCSSNQILIVVLFKILPGCGLSGVRLKVLIMC